MSTIISLFQLTRVIYGSFDWPILPSCIAVTFLTFSTFFTLYHEEKSTILSFSSKRRRQNSKVVVSNLRRKSVRSDMSGVSDI